MAGRHLANVPVHFATLHWAGLAEATPDGNCDWQELACGKVTDRGLYLVGPPGVVIVLPLG